MKSINGNIVSNCVLQDIVIRDIIWNIVISKSCWWINSKQYVANTYFEVDKTSSFSFSHFCSSSSSVVWEILLVSSLVIIWSRVFLCGYKNAFEYMYYIMEFCNEFHLIKNYIIWYYSQICQCLISYIFSLSIVSFLT